MTWPGKEDIRTGTSHSILGVHVRIVPRARSEVMSPCSADEFGRVVPTERPRSEKKERWHDVYETLGHFRNERESVAT